MLVGQKIVTSSSVSVDEEHFDWAPPEKCHQPLTAVSHAAAPEHRQPLLPEGAETRPLRFLDLVYLRKLVGGLGERD